MKIKKAVMLLAACALSIFAVTAHADAAAVAKIGDTEYETFAAAAESVKSGDTLTLLSDITNRQYLYFNGVKNITLDLNGYTLNTITIEILGGAELTVTNTAGDGKLMFISDNVGFKIAESTLNIENGTICADESVWMLIASHFDGQTHQNAANVNINGGVIDAGEGFVIATMTNTNVNITDGIVSGNFFVKSGEGAIPNGVNITGGTFNDESIKEYITADITANDDGSFTVGKKTEIDTVNAGAITAEDGTVATGFLTKIKNAGTVNTIKWTVTSDGKSADSDAFAVNMTLNGDASFGLVVDGLCDANAAAVAVID